jgi:hypothetical protein
MDKELRNALRVTDLFLFVFRISFSINPKHYLFIHFYMSLTELYFMISLK